MLARSLADYNDINLVYTSYFEPPRSIEDAIEAIISTMYQAGLRDLVPAVLSDMVEKKIGAKTGL